MNKRGSIAALALLMASGAACAHVVLEPTSAPAGSSYRAVLRVGHGCDGHSTRGLPLPAAPLQVEPAAQDHTHH